METSSKSDPSVPTAPRRRRLANRDRVLLALASFEPRGERQVSAEELIIAAWRADPDRFGLAGYAATYPDANRVLIRVMGANGLVYTGLAECTAPKMYRLTKAGAARAVALRRAERSDGAIPVAPATRRETCR